MLRMGRRLRQLPPSSIHAIRWLQLRLVIPVSWFVEAHSWLIQWMVRLVWRGFVSYLHRFSAPDPRQTSLTNLGCSTRPAGRDQPPTQLLRPIHRLRPLPHARPRCWHMPQRGVPRPVSCYYKLAPGQQRVPALRLMMATTPARLMTWRPGSSRASPASSSTRLGGSGRCSSRGGSGRRRLRRGRWRSRRRWFPWRVRSRVGVAEGVWREVCVCVCVSSCQREVRLGCVRGWLFCVWLCA